MKPAALRALADAAEALARLARDAAAELEADLFERQMAPPSSPQPRDTIPSPPPSEPPAPVIVSGQATPVVASAIDAAALALRELAAVADACARALDATAPPPRKAP